MVDGEKKHNMLKGAIILGIVIILVIWIYSLSSFLGFSAITFQELVYTAFFFGLICLFIFSLHLIITGDSSKINLSKKFFMGLFFIFLFFYIIFISMEVYIVGENHICVEILKSKSDFSFLPEASGTALSQQNVNYYLTENPKAIGRCDILNISVDEIIERGKKDVKYPLKIGFLAKLLGEKFGLG